MLKFPPLVDNLGQVHERSVEGDFLLLELKELLKLNSTLKVVLMSATINHETFIHYFSDAPLLSIPGFTHPVTDLWDSFSIIDWTVELTIKLTGSLRTSSTSSVIALLLIKAERDRTTKICLLIEKSVSM